MFWIWSLEHNAWWCPDGQGYTDNLEYAGRFPLEQAVQHCNSGNHRMTRDDPPSEAMVPVF